MRNSTTTFVRRMMRFLIEFMDVRLPMDVSWHCGAARIARQESGRVEDPPCTDEIELTPATGMMELCGFISRC